MWGAILLLGLLIGLPLLVYIVHKIKHKDVLLTTRQIRFMIVSTVLLFVFVILFRSFLLGGAGSANITDKEYLQAFVFNDENFMIPVLYILWYFVAVMVGNSVITGNDDYSGFFSDPNPFISTREEQPR